LYEIKDDLEGIYAILFYSFGSHHISLNLLHQKAVQGIFKDQYINWGMKVAEVRMRPTPDFGRSQRFLVQSPILIQRDLEDGDQHKKYFYHSDP